LALKFTILTRPNTRKLAVGQKLSEHGITFERLPSGDGAYSVNVMVDGVRIHRRIGTESTGTTREQCEQFIEQARTDARAGRLQLPTGRKIALGFAQAVEAYLARLSEAGGKDIPMKRNRFRLHLTPFFGETPLSKISAFDIERYKKQRTSELSVRGGIRTGKVAAGKSPGGRVTSVAPGTVNLELAALSHLMSKAVEWGWISHKPPIRKFKLDNARSHYLTTEQISSLLAAAQQDINPQVYLFMVIALETSMRRMEILSMRLEHIDLDRRTIFIPQAKAGARAQPITKHLADFLRGYCDAAEPGQEWLFPARTKTAKTGHATSIESAFRRVVTAAGLDASQVLRHTLRHTAITHLVQAGVDLPTVQRISGHKTLTMVVRYAHQNGTHIQEAMDKLEARYRPTTNGAPDPADTRQTAAE
jgi:integrase